MKKEYVAVFLGALFAASIASGASFIGTMNTVSAQEVRINNIENAFLQNAESHKEMNTALKELTLVNTEMQVTLMRVATTVAIKLEAKGG